MKYEIYIEDNELIINWNGTIKKLGIKDIIPSLSYFDDKIIPYDCRNSHQISCIRDAVIKALDAETGMIYLTNYRDKTDYEPVIISKICDLGGFDLPLMTYTTQNEMRQLKAGEQFVTSAGCFFTAASDSAPADSNSLPGYEPAYRGNKITDTNGKVHWEHEFRKEHSPIEGRAL
jgi:hypothetical protein